MPPFIEMSYTRTETDGSCLGIEISSGMEIIPRFYHIFQGGFLFPCQVETSIDDLLLRQLGLKPEFVEKKINTVFLDGRCVDDISSAILKDGSVVAFSSALPGLAGATLRRGGHYACMRDSITHINKNRPETRRDGYITIKIFNLLMAELGRVFLEKGILMNRHDAVDLLKKDHEDLRRQGDSIIVGGRPLSSERIVEEIPLAEKSHILVRIVMNSKTGTEDPPSAGEQ